jgi:ribosomal protein S12 methylthiotransferase accessory factor
MVSPAGHARSYEETEEWLRTVLTRVPITRIFDATPLDVLGLPVWCAVTPLAADLTVHAGKGATPPAARLSAVMESIERLSGESVAGERVLRASHRRLSAVSPAIDPELFDLPFDTRYRPDLEMDWVPGYDLLTERHFYVARDLVVSPAVEGICGRIETNGLAAGNSMTESTLHAVYEVVERHVVSEARFHDLYHDQEEAHRRPLRMIDVSTLPVDSLEWIRRIRDEGMDLVVRDLTNDLGIPVFVAYLTNDSFPGAEGETIAFGGYGADLDPARAVFRAITEAVQSHTGTVLGARDTFEGGAVTNERTAMLRRHLSTLHPGEVQPFPPSPPSSYDLYEDMKEVLARLRRGGIEHCVVVDLTREDFGVPAVRVLVPGLAAPFGESTRRPGRRLLQSLV